MSWPVLYLECGGPKIFRDQIRACIKGNYTLCDNTDK